MSKPFHGSFEGMAHFAGTGPTGETCGGCVHRQHRQPYHQGRPPICRKFTQLTGRQSAGGIPSTTLACKYFEPGKLLPGSNSEYRARIRGK
jgi:hypothetical protein